ncbi:MAG: TolC family protein [Bacteroidia bacterium]|nr:TolC family protein [Bacteroidia bacterium]
MNQSEHLMGTVVKSSVKMKTEAFLILFLLVVSGNALVAQETWSLNRCVSFAVENNIGLKKMQVLEQMAGENLKQAKRNLLPGLSASSSANYSFGRSIDPNTNDYVNTAFFNNSYELGASVTVFNASNQIYMIEYQKFRKKASELNRLSATDDLAFLVMNSYFEVVYQQGLLEIANEQVKASAVNLKKMEKMVELGMKSKTDLLEIRANYESEELKRIQVENTLKTARLTLKQQMNNNSSEDIVPENLNTPMVASGQADQQALFTSYLKWSPYFQSYEAQVQSVKKYISVSRSQLLPNISAYGGMSTGFYETTKDDNGKVIAFGQQFNNNLSQYLGASINIPIFNRMATRSEIAKAKLELDQAKFTMDEEKQKLCFEMANNLNEMEALEKEYTQYLRQQEADQQAYLAAEVKFEQGLVNVVDFYVAKNRLGNTRAQLLKTRLMWEVKKNIIEFYSGKRFWESPS